MNIPAAIACLSQAEHFRDFGTNTHAKRAARLIEHICSGLGMPRESSREIAVAALVHDIGKLAIPLDLLNKPGGLSAEELSVVKTHSHRGFSILESGSDGVMKLAAEIALHHHERYDGSGYPHGLAGEQISRPARIVSICDTYDALREDRPYRRGLSHSDAVSTIVKGDRRTLPQHFDPEVLSVFAASESDIERTFRDFDAFESQPGRLM